MRNLRASVDCQNAKRNIETLGLGGRRRKRRIDWSKASRVWPPSPRFAHSQWPCPNLCSLSSRSWHAWLWVVVVGSGWAYRHRSCGRYRPSNWHPGMPCQLIRVPRTWPAQHLDAGSGCERPAILWPEMTFSCFVNELDAIDASQPGRSHAKLGWKRLPCVLRSANARPPAARQMRIW